MQFLNNENKTKLAFLGAVTLFLAYIEMLFPHFVPFFKLGLGNIAVLLALEFNFPVFVFFIFIKTFVSSLTGGTLISPFFLLSAAQSFSSAIVMYGLFRIRIKGKKFFSVYGVSFAGSAVSALVQILCASIYLGKETLRLLGPMLIFSIFSALLTAFCASFLKLPEKPIVLSETQNPAGEKKSGANFYHAIILVILAVFCFIIDDIKILTLILCFSIVLQICSGRKLFILPHLSVWIFVIIMSLFTPSGKVLFSAGKIAVTQDALIEGIKKAMKLSAAVCLSQCITKIKLKEDSVFGLTFLYYQHLIDLYHIQEGNLLKKIKATLSECGVYNKTHSTTSTEEKSS